MFFGNWLFHGGNRTSWTDVAVPVVVLGVSLNANYMTDWLKKKNTIEVLTVSILTITSFVYLFYNGLYDRCRLLAEMGGYYVLWLSFL